MAGIIATIVFGSVCLFLGFILFLIALASGAYGNKPVQDHALAEKIADKVEEYEAAKELAARKGREVENMLREADEARNPRDGNWFTELCFRAYNYFFPKRNTQALVKQKLRERGLV